MKKQPKDKTPQPQKANETSFKPGNKDSEKWTYEIAKSFFEQALELSKDAITLTDISNELGVYRYSFEYICTKYPDFDSIKKEMLSNIENNTYKGALNGNLVPSVAIFGLKNNHGWKDKTEVDHTTKGQSLNRPPLEFFSSESETD